MGKFPGTLSLLVLLVALASIGHAFSPKALAGSAGYSTKRLVQSSTIRHVKADVVEDSVEATDVTDTTAEAKEPTEVRGGDMPRSIPPMPTIANYRKFALPCLGLWVMGPLLSLVDTAFVGLSGESSQSAAQLAALGPATTFFDGATYLFAFLNVATTNLYSSARAQNGAHAPRTESVVRTAARMALYCGFGAMTLLLLFSKKMLTLYIGGTSKKQTTVKICCCCRLCSVSHFVPSRVLLEIEQDTTLLQK